MFASILSGLCCDEGFAVRPGGETGRQGNGTKVEYVQRYQTEVSSEYFMTRVGELGRAYSNAPVDPGRLHFSLTSIVPGMHDMIAMLLSLNGGNAHRSHRSYSSLQEAGSVAK